MGEEISRNGTQQLYTGTVYGGNRIYDENACESVRQRPQCSRQGHQRCATHCGSEVAEREKGFFCTSRECRFVVWKDNAFFARLGKRPTRQVVDKLLRDGRARLKDCKSQRTGKTYNASVLMTTEADGRAKFSMEFENGGAR